MNLVLLDLDGTVSDSALGIISCLRRAFDALGIPRLDPTTEQSLVGPPFSEALPPLVGRERTEQVTALYRECYGNGGMFETKAFDGIPQMLSRLRRAGRTLAIATSKPEHYAVPIVEHLGLTEYFETVCGDTLEGARDSKALVVGEALRRLGSPPPEDVVMVGDRAHDVIGARAHDIDCLGAGWGYALPDELADAGAVAIFDTPEALASALLEPAASDHGAR